MSVEQRCPSERIACVDVSSVVQEVVRHFFVLPVGGDVKEGAVRRKSFRLPHTRVDVNPGMQHRLQDFPLPAQRACVDWGPAVDVCGEDLGERWREQEISVNVRVVRKTCSMSESK